MRKLKASPISVLSVIAILLILFYMVIGATGYRGLIPGSNHFRNKREEGFHVFYRLLEELEYDIEFEKAYSIPRGTGNLMVYLDMNETDEASIGRLQQWVERGNVLFLFDEAINSFFQTEALEAGEEGKILTRGFINKLNKLKANSDDGKRFPPVSIVQAGKGSIHLISDRAAFNNRNIDEPGRALRLDSLFYPYREGTIFLREKTSEAVFDPTLLKGLFQGKLSIITLHLLLIFLMVVLLNGKRFSRPHQSGGKEVRKISEHIKAMGLFYRKAGASQLIEKSDSQYFKWIICRGRKPSLLNEEQFEDYSEIKSDLSEEEIISRFRFRNKLKSELRREKK